MSKITKPKRPLKQFNFDFFYGKKTSKSLYLIYGVWVIKIPKTFNHPGGTKLLEKFKAPLDCSMYFETTRNGRGHSKDAEKLLKSFILGYIGEFEPNSEAGALLKSSTSISDKFKNLGGFIIFLLIHVYFFYYLLDTNHLIN